MLGSPATCTAAWHHPAVDALFSPLAHGGTGGLIVELSLIAVLVALAVAAWLRTRARDGEDLEEPGE